MISKKNRAAVRLPANAVLNCDDRKKFSAFVALLVQVNKRINPEEYAAPARARSKRKTKECNLENLYKKGSQSPTSLKLRRTGCGPSLLLTTALSLWKHFKLCSIGKTDDRHYRITSFSGCFSNY